MIFKVQRVVWWLAYWLFGVELICGAKTKSIPPLLAWSLLSLSPNPSNDSPPVMENDAINCTIDSARLRILWLFFYLCEKRNEREKKRRRKITRTRWTWWDRTWVIRFGCYGQHKRRTLCWYFAWHYYTRERDLQIQRTKKHTIFSH